MELGSDKAKKLATLRHSATTYLTMVALNKEVGPVSKKVLAKESGLSDQTVKRHLKELRKAGLCRAVYHILVDSVDSVVTIKTKTLKEARQKSKETGGQIAPALYEAI